MCRNVTTEMSPDRNSQSEISRDRNGPDRNGLTERPDPSRPDRIGLPQIINKFATGRRNLYHFDVEISL